MIEDGKLGVITGGEAGEWRVGRLGGESWGG